MGFPAQHSKCFHNAPTKQHGELQHSTILPSGTDFCPRLLLFAMIKHWPPKHLGRKGLGFYILTIEGRQARNTSRNRDRNQGKGLLAGLLSMAYSVCFLIQPRSTYPGVAQPTVGLALLYHSIDMKKMPHRHNYKPIDEANMSHMSLAASLTDKTQQAQRGCYAYVKQLAPNQFGLKYKTNSNDIATPDAS